MTRFILECDDADDLVEGVRLIQRLVRRGADRGTTIFEPHAAIKPQYLWHAYKTKSGFVARQCRDEEEKP